MPRIAITLGIVVLFIAGVSVLARFVYENRSVSYFSHVLSARAIPVIHVRDQAFEIRDGRAYEAGTGELASLHTEARVLGIANFYVHAREDPYFAIDGTDTGIFKNAVHELELTIPLLASRYDTETAHMIERSLYPIDFLSELARLQEARNAFLTLPSIDTYAPYRDRLLNIMRTYQESLRNFRADSYRAIGEGSYVFADGSLNRDSHRAMLDILIQNSLERESELRRLVACTAGAVHMCDSLPTLFTGSEEHATTTQNVRLRETTFILTSGGFLSPDTDYTRIALSSSECLPDAPALYDVASGQHGLKLVPLNDVYFWRIEGAQNQSAYVQWLQELGFSFVFQSPNNPYECWGGGGDFARVATMITIQNLLTEAPLFLKLRTDDSDDRALAALERNIVQADILREGDLDSYARDVHTLVQSLGEEAFVDQYGYDTLERAYEIISIWRNQTGSYDSLVHAIENFNLVGLASSGSPPVPSSLFFISRSMSNITFAFSNRSINRVQPTLSGETSFSGRRLASFWKDLYPSMTRADAVQAIRDTIQLIGNTSTKNE